MGLGDQVSRDRGIFRMADGGREIIMVSNPDGVGDGS